MDYEAIREGTKNTVGMNLKKLGSAFKWRKLTWWIWLETSEEGFAASVARTATKVSNGCANLG